MFEKLDDFENRPSSKGYTPCKDYSLCKIFSLGQKLKWPKTCAKWLYKRARVVVWKKPAGKNTKYSRYETILKIGHLAKAIGHAKAIAFAKCSAIMFCYNGHFVLQWEVMILQISFLLCEGWSCWERICTAF